MEIRFVREADFEVWLQLRYDLWPYHTMEELHNELMGIYGEIETKPVFLAVNSDVVYGFIELSVIEEAPGCSTNRIGYIEGWYVKPEYRGQGVGKALVRAGEEWAKNIGCKEMASDTTQRYPLSPSAHLALGYEEVKPLHYRKSLE